MQIFPPDCAQRKPPQHVPGAKGANYEIRVISTNGKSGKCPYYTANRLRFQEKSELFKNFVNYDKVLCQWYYVNSVTQSCPKIELFGILYHIWCRLPLRDSKYGLCRNSCAEYAWCKSHLLLCILQDLLHHLRLLRFGFRLARSAAKIAAPSAGTATQRMPPGGALTNSRLPSSSNSRYPPVLASV